MTKGKAAVTAVVAADEAVVVARSDGLRVHESGLVEGPTGAVETYLREERDRKQTSSADRVGTLPRDAFAAGGSSLQWRCRECGRDDVLMTSSVHEGRYFICAPGAGGCAG